MFTLENITQLVHEWLYATMHPTLALLIEFFIIGVLIIGLFAVLGLVLIMMERKVSSWMQLRLGPNRVGPGGMFQTVADTIKLIVKEGMTPDSVDKLLFNIAPFIVMVIAMVVMAPIAFAKGFQIWDINIGVLFVLAVSSISVIGILMAGWASNNKYSLMGAMRSGAQIVSYELSAGLAVLTIVVLSGGLKFQPSLNRSKQDGGFSKVTFPPLSHLLFLSLR
jgi:NADH-quinone oxidoreductase subunit H